MSELTIISTRPGAENYALFSELPKSIYAEGSQRFILGNDPVDTLLEGCHVLLKDGNPVGRFAFYENPNLNYEDKRVCTIGSFECVNDLAISNQLLSHSVELAKEKEYQFIIGPMEGSTWNNYRFSHHNKSPNFFMEPFHHEYYASFFEDFGFKSIADYISNLDTEISFEEGTIAKFEKIYKDKGAIFRNLDLSNLEDELRKIARFNNDAFSKNFLFTPISEDDFVKKYIQYKDYFNPDLIWIVEDENAQIQALSFSIKDYLNQQEESLIIKSLARRSNSPYRGIGAYLIHKTYQLAKEQGYKSIVHALMLKDNVSVNISEKYADGDYKSYSLYGYAL